MLGFSMDQLLVIAAACMLILGPQKTLAAAYWLGSRMGKFKKLIDECKRELTLQNLTGTDLKSEIAGDLKDLNAEARRMSADLHDAMRTDATSATGGKSRASSHVPLSGRRESEEISAHAGIESKQEIEVRARTDNAASFSADELTARIAALETELAAIKDQLKRRSEGTFGSVEERASTFGKELEA